jgi:hypothetical protein
VRKLLTTVCIAAIALAAPAAATAKPHHKPHPKPTAGEKSAAKRYCQQLRKSSGKKNFREMFGDGPKHLHAMRNCKRKQANELARERVASDQDAQKNAAKECKAERAADPDAFREQYGTGPKGRNAFGKCVSQHAKKHRQEAAADQEQEEQNELNAAKKCKAERKADPEAFRTTYGTNRNGRNAFGKCVSKKAHEAEEQQS